MDIDEREYSSRVSREHSRPDDLTLLLGRTTCANFPAVSYLINPRRLKAAPSTSSIFDNKFPDLMSDATSLTSYPGPCRNLFA